LTKDIRKPVFAYMSGITTNLKHKSILINGTSNHVHILPGLIPAISVSDTVHDIVKANPCLSIVKNYALTGFHGRRVTVDLHIAVQVGVKFTNTLKIRNHIIHGEHFVKNMSEFIPKTRLNLISNTCLIFGRILFNLYEVKSYGVQ
jgi:hypothetical protein